MRKTADDHMRDALRRVIQHDGVASWPSSNICPAAMVNQWRKATTCGYLRVLDDDEVEAYLANRRGVRAVLLAQLELAALDEDRAEPFSDWDPASVEMLGEKLAKVCFEIRWLKTGANSGYTLTPEGVRFLGACE